MRTRPKTLGDLRKMIMWTWGNESPRPRVKKIEDLDPNEPQWVLNSEPDPELETKSIEDE